MASIRNHRSFSHAQKNSLPKQPHIQNHGFVVVLSSKQLFLAKALINYHNELLFISRLKDSPCFVTALKKFFKSAVNRRSNMQYKTIFKSFSSNFFVNKTSGDAKSPQIPNELDDWNNALNNYGKDGWVITNSGLIGIETGILLFWAVFEREEKMEGTILG